MSSGSEESSAEVEASLLRPADGRHYNVHGIDGGSQPWRRDGVSYALPSGAATRGAAPSQEDQDTSMTMLTILPSGDVANAVQARLDQLALHEESADIGCDEGLKKMTDAIGPILIISLTVVVGFFALAIYMPMWELTEMVNKK